jgi:hypothetical protein
MKADSCWGGRMLPGHQQEDQESCCCYTRAILHFIYISSAPIG